MRGYPGGKAGAGVYQRIINEMPPHRLYIEPFVGGGAILLRKRPAEASIVIDADRVVADRWSTIARSGAVAGLTAMHGDCQSLIAEMGELSSSTLIYADPPYVRSSRRSAAPIYRHELTDQDHRGILSLFLASKTRVMVSGYRNPIYDEMLAAWRRIDFRTMTRGGPAIESLWCNFEAAERHDYSYIGENFRERERIKRKRARWRRRLVALPELERQALLATLLELATPETASGPGRPRQVRRSSSALANTAAPGDRRRRPGGTARLGAGSGNAGPGGAVLIAAPGAAAGPTRAARAAA